MIKQTVLAAIILALSLSAPDAFGDNSTKLMSAKSIAIIIADPSSTRNKKLIALALANKYGFVFNKAQNDIIFNFVIDDFFSKKTNDKEKSKYLDFFYFNNILFDAKKLEKKLSDIFKLKGDLSKEFFTVLYQCGGYTNIFFNYLIAEAEKEKINKKTKILIITLLQQLPYSIEDVKNSIKKNNGIFSVRFFAYFLDSQLEEEKDKRYKSALKSIYNILIKSDELLIEIDKHIEFNSYLNTLEFFNLQALGAKLTTLRLLSFVKSKNNDLKKNYIEQIASEDGNAQLSSIDSKQFHLFSSFLIPGLPKTSKKLITALNNYFDFIEFMHPSSSEDINIWKKFLESEKFAQEFKQPQYTIEMQ